MTAPESGDGGGDAARGSPTAHRDRAGVLSDALRLIVITDAAMVAARSDRRTVRDVVSETLDAGGRAIQLRTKGASAREMAAAARELLPLVHAHGGLLFVNDRADVASAVGADGVHVGPNDLPVAAIRKAFDPRLLVGCSTDDPVVARQAERDGADYLGCGAVFGTTSKDVGDEAIGPEGLRAVVEAVDIPVVGIGGITPARTREVLDTGAAGVAVIGAVMAAEDPGSAVRRLLSDG